MNKDKTLPEEHILNFLTGVDGVDMLGHRVAPHAGIHYFMFEATHDAISTVMRKLSQPIGHNTMVTVFFSDKLYYQMVVSPGNHLKALAELLKGNSPAKEKA